MQHDISKLCADSLRTVTNNKYDTKLKAAHAHELVAAFFGYLSKNAMLADKKYPLSNLDKSIIIVMMPEAFIDQRRSNLQGLSPELPDSYILGEAVYVSMFSSEWWSSEYPPFRSFEKLARYLVENNEAYKEVFKFYRDIPMHHIVDVKDEEDGVILTVIHSHKASEQMIGDGKTTITLKRVAGRIGYGRAHVSVEQWTGGAQKVLEPLEVQS